MEASDKQRVILDATLANIKKDWPLSDFFSLSLAWAFPSGDYAYNINSFPKLLLLYKSSQALYS